MKWIINIFMISVLFSIIDCSAVKKKAEDKWKAVVAYLFLSKAPSKVSMNISLVGADGKSMTIGNTSVKDASSVSDESAKPSENSSVGAPGSAGQKAGGETLNLNMDGTPKSVEVLDSNGNYAGTITVTPRTGEETYTNSFLSFALRSDSEPAAGAVQAVITGEVIVTEVPFQDLTKLSAVFTIDGEKVKVDGADQVTGKTVNDFSQNRTFSVFAKNGTEKKYTVITKKKYYTCELAGLYFTDYPLTAVRQNSDSSSVWYEAVLPPDADITSLRTSFSVFGNSVKVGSNVQTSGQTLNSFSSPVTFTVSGSNGCSADYTVKVSKESLAAGKSLKNRKNLTRGELELVDFPEITKLGAVGIPKTVSTVELKPYGYFDDVSGEYVFTKGQVILMVPYGTLFDNINLEVETKNNTKKVIVDGKDYVRGNSFVKFMQRNGSEKYTVDTVLVDKYSAFEVPYEIQIVMSAPPPFVAVSKDSTFMLFVNSTAASARDGSNEVAEIIQWFAPFAGSTISDLKTVLAKVNELKITVARWTVDPGKVDLNIIGQGFKAYDFDVESYEEDMKCYLYPVAVSQSDWKFRTVDEMKNYWYNRDSYLQAIHKVYCGYSKGNEKYPNYVKNYPHLINYGRIVNNAKTVDGYGIKAENLNQEMDPAFFAKTLTSEVPNMNQNGNGFYLYPARGEKVLYELPAVNYLEKMEPNNGTVGTEVLATFAATIEDNTYSISCTMDNVPVLNLRVRDSRSVYFNVPNISRGTRVSCEKMPLSPTKGNRFVMISTEAFRMKPYTPLADLSFPSSEVTFAVDEQKNIQGSVKQGRISYCWLSSGKLPYGLYLDGRCRIFGKLVAEEAASELTVVASDGYQQSSFKLKAATKPAVIIKPPVVNYPAAGYFLLVGKKFSIAPISEKIPGVQYSINRTLPIGVTFDRETGTVSGYPVDTMSATTFIISAANEAGYAKYSLTLQINPDKTGFSPPSLGFSSSSYTVTKDQSITLTPTVSGSQPFEFSASGLPDGMSVDQDTGIISGTPISLASDAKAYVTVKNYAGITKVALAFTVTTTPSPAPSSLAFTSSTYSLTVGTPISSIVPTYTGILSSCNSTPALPIGLSLSSTCSITGTPAASQTMTYFTITGSNSSGSTSATLGLVTGNFPPSALAYSGSPYVFSHNSPITVQTPSYSGGITSCTSSPTLPTGLSLNPSTCAIGGTPTVIQAATGYTITATNAYGSTTAGINISVATVPPSALTYLGSPYTFSLPGAVSTGTPSISGSPLSSCTISPALPAGMSINNSNCTVSGTPTDPLPLTNYTITATNAAGSTTANISMKIQATYNFTNAGVAGRSGPTQTQTNTAYSGTSLQGKVTTTGGIQRFVVPLTGTYSIEVYGAQGGTNDSNYARGAILKSSIALNAGDVLWILVGQQGLYNGTCDAYNQAGGGGGTFVTKGATQGTSTPLMIAGGGGGACWKAHYAGFYDGSFSRSHASTGTSGQSGGNFSACSIGTGGSAGSAGEVDHSDDASYPNHFDAAAGWLSGGISSKTFYAGGQGTLSNPVGADGGFGGGGSSYNTVSYGKAAGGGGYSGGGSGCVNSGDVGNGGGGGSFYTGSPSYFGSASTGNVGHGKVVIIYQ